MNRRNIVIAIGVLIVVFAWYAYSLEELAEGEGGDFAYSLDSTIVGPLFLKMGASVMLGVYFSVLFLVYVIPKLSEQVSNFVFSDPNEEVERDMMGDARSFMAQGEYDGAIAAYRHAAREDPQNRLPWVEIAKIQKEQLKSPGGAAATYAEALEAQEWDPKDAAYFMFRISELQIDDLNEVEAGVEVLKQVIELFPKTRHAANANGKLRELAES